MSIMGIYNFSFVAALMSWGVQSSAQGCLVDTSNKMDSIIQQVKAPVINFTGPIESMEFVGIGLSLEDWRSHASYPKNNLWNAIKENKGGYIVSQDVGKYPKNISEWKMTASKRAEDAVDAAMREFMDRYPLPMAVVGPSWGVAEGGVRGKKEGNRMPVGLLIQWMMIRTQRVEHLLGC